jgi:M6 family metalloprotease-like protein
MGDVEVARSNGWGWFESTYVWHDWFGIGNERPAMGDLDNDGRDDAIIFKQANAQVLVALDAAPSVLEPDSRAAAFGYDFMRSEDGARARGARPLLTVLLDFSDVQFKAPHGQSYFRDMLFTGDTDFHTISGMFREMSFGQFWFTDAGVLAPFRATDNPSTPTVDESTRECAKGNTNACPGTTSTEAGLWTNALRANAWNVDFARFDTNHNGMVTESELTIAFVNASDFGDGNGTSFRLGCVWVSGPSGGVYVCPWISTVAEGISFATFAHELAHTLGAHDLYNSTNVMGQDATLMNNLLTSGAPRASVELDAWHKMALGWVMPRIYDIAQPGSCDFLQVSLADEFFDAATWYERPILLYDSRRGGNEFFLLEYRLKDSWFNRYDADVQATGLSIWYVQQNAAHDSVYIPGLQIHAGNNGVLQSVAASGSDDFVSGNSVWSGGDEIWQSVRAGDDDYYWDRAVLQLPVGGRRGDTDIHVLGEGRFRARYLLPWEDAELAIETASIGNPQWLAVRWGHHALDVLPRVGNNDLFQYCHDRFPH